ncbi:MAG: translation initiation factor IF-2 [Endomicrobiales bacterium]|nr:translation initiation factor IF-2 [Endomicrobiales bacterium]
MTQKTPKQTAKKTAKEAAKPKKSAGAVPAKKETEEKKPGKKATAVKKVQAPVKKKAVEEKTHEAVPVQEVKEKKPVKKAKAAPGQHVPSAVHEKPEHPASAAKPAHPKTYVVKPEKPEEIHKKDEKPHHPHKAEQAVKPQEVHKIPEPGTEAPAEPVPSKAPEAPKAPVYKGEVKINELITIRDLAERMNEKPGELLKKLLSMGTLATINQRLDREIAELLAQEFGYKTKFESVYSEDAMHEVKDDPSKLKPRPPVVTIMGHVDHGKTSLLDAIRESNVVDGEAGGITQHIGAYKVKTAHGAIAFLDTPGHEAFTAMRSRGAKATDIVVLVVSAGDGVMPQTVEAIDHARAAGVPIIVAINKIDLPTANPQQTKQELSKYNLVSEDWGGDTIMVEVSAKKRINIQNLLEMVLLKAEMMELKADPDRTAQGVVIEAKLDSKRGPVATVLVQTGTLKIGDNIVLGTTYGKVRAMVDEHGMRLASAPPSTPVEILGINTPPQAGDTIIAVGQEYQAREVAESRANRAKEDALRPRHHLSLEDIAAGKVKDLRIVLKADVQGSIGALSDALERLSTSEINLKIIHSGAGGITESDIMLAAASDAMIIGFNIRPDTYVEKLAESEGVSIRIYRIIYELIADVKAAMEGMLEPQLKEVNIGKAFVKQTFRITKVGMVAGCMVSEGKIQRVNKVRLVRDSVIVYEGVIASLHRFKDDVREVDKGFECGIALENFADIKTGDVIESFTQEKIARKL